MAMLGCTGSSRPPPVRGPDTGTTPDATAGAAAAVSGITASAENIVNVYNWSDFIDPSVIPAFEREYGIKVNYDVFDSNEELETKLLVGQSNYDVVVPAGGFLERGLKAGVYQKLDKAQLPNFKNLDPEAMRDIAVYDPGNLYAADYTWLTSTGIGYDVAKINARMADAPVDSWRMICDPADTAIYPHGGFDALLQCPGER
jgi:putrescine transport system substrate-binding protein